MIWHRLLVLLLLSPWLLAVWIGTLNLRHSRPRRLHVLVWNLPALPIGTWLLVGSSLGTALSATAVGLLLQPASRPARRQAGDRRPDTSPLGGTVEQEQEPMEPDRETSWVNDRAPFDSSEFDSSEDDRSNFSTTWGSPPVRNVDEPPPTMDVPFRVVRFSGDATDRQNADTHRTTDRARQQPTTADSDWDQQESGQW